MYGLLQFECSVPSTEIPGAPSDLVVSTIDDQTLGVSFIPGVGAASHEEIHAPMVYQSTGWTATGCWSNPATISNNQIPNCWAGRRHQVRVRARGATGGVSAWTSVATGDTAFAASTNIITTNLYYTPSGDPYTDGLLYYLPRFSGSRKILTYSFPSSGVFYDGGAGTYGFGEALPESFVALTTQQMNACRWWFFMYQLFLPIDFEEVTETADVHGDIRFARQSATANSFCKTWFSLNWTDGEEGDVWISQTYVGAGTPVPGNYPWFVFGHEMGHALGLKDAHLYSPTMPLDQDWLEHTMMSYREYPNEPTGAISGHTPHSPMIADIRSLQYVHGVRADIGDLKISFNPDTGAMTLTRDELSVTWPQPNANKIYRTIWAPGSGDKYDFTNYAPGEPSVNLTAGQGSYPKSAQRTSLWAGYTAQCLRNPWVNNGLVESVDLP